MRRKFNTEKREQPLPPTNNGYPPNNQQYPNYNGNYQQPPQPNGNYSQQGYYQQPPQPNGNYNQQGYYQQPNDYQYSNGGYQQPPQKPKKPFYKKWWFWLLAVILILFITAGIGSGSSSKQNKSSSNSKTENVQKKEKNPKSNDPSLEDYKAIQLGENNGTSESELESKFGKPSTTSSQTIQNVKAEEKIWDKIQGGDFGGNFSVGFSNGKAISKTITGLKVQRNKKISLQDFNTIQNGQSKEEIFNKFGKPNQYSESKVGNQSSEMDSFTSNIKGETGANFNVTFTNGKVSGKSQTSMK